MRTTGSTHIPIVRWAVSTTAALLLATSASADAPPPPDALYSALHGEPERVEGAALVAAPGRFVGRAVRTSGGLVTVDAGAAQFEIAIGRSRVLLRLEPEARAVVTARAASWGAGPVIVEGLFYRESGPDPATSPYALRAWQVWPVKEPARPAEAPPSDAATVSLQELVYGGGRYDGRLVHVRGAYRGSNRHADLPEGTRKSRSDWVIKDGYFAAWVTGREARGDNWNLAERSSKGTESVVEIVGVPTTKDGVVRIQAREVGLSMGFVGGALGLPRDAGLQSIPPRVSFAWPIPGESLRRHGQIVLQFSKPLDPQSLEARVRVRYGASTPAPNVRYEYRQRYRALVVTPEPAPPPGTEVVVELLEGIIDVDGRALAPRVDAGDRATTAGEGVVDAVPFRSAR